MVIICRAWTWHRYRLLVLNQIPQDADPSDPLAYASWMKCRMKLWVHDTWYLIQIVLVFGDSLFICPDLQFIVSCLYINSISRWTGRFQVSQERLEENGRLLSFVPGFQGAAVAWGQPRSAVKAETRSPASGATKMWYLQCWTCSRSTTVDLDDGRI